MLVRPARSEAKATSRPSGLHAGSTLALVSTTSGVGVPPATSMMYSPAVPPAVDTNTNRSPDGAQLGLASTEPANPNPAVSGRSPLPSAAHSHSFGTPLESVG